MEVISLATIDDVISDLNSDEHLKSAAGLTPEIIESVAEYRRKFARQKAST